ncbi:unnamed protein product [Cuscuta epithymum]|uniref:F-box domain-containing protein n=1 Tax=Cuscuta epithymum TaxID=186058 RepID=A0AAV0DGC5_9ASTE|nr:unnamed protein product [Cuscuta epithymum]
MYIGMSGTENQTRDEESPVNGDILEVVLSRAPLVDLVAASLVSKSWSHAVTSSLRWLNKPKPWLFVHTQSTRSPQDVATRAFDHRSSEWVDIAPNAAAASSVYVSPIRSSNSNLIYMLSPTTLSFSFHALSAEWHHVPAPTVWRTDPIVAYVAGSIVIAGGTCDFEDDPLAVEMHSLEDGATWQTCHSMPPILKDSSASTWLSIATTSDKLVVTEKLTGATHCFNPRTKTWSGPYNLRPDPRMSLSIIGFSEDRGLVLMGTIVAGDAQGVKLWDVNSETFECVEIGEMPAGLVGKLQSETFGLSSINLCTAGDYVHIYNGSHAEDVVVCELGGGGGEWWSIKNMAVGDNGNSKMERVVFTSSSEVGVDELRRAMRSGQGTTFTVCDRSR